jgi:hypothetical protein
VGKEKEAKLILPEDYGRNVAGERLLKTVG